MRNLHSHAEEHPCGPGSAGSITEVWLETCITKSPPTGETKNMQFSKQKKAITIKILQGPEVQGKSIPTTHLTRTFDSHETENQKARTYIQNGYRAPLAAR